MQILFNFIFIYFKSKPLKTSINQTENLQEIIQYPSSFETPISFE